MSLLKVENLTKRFTGIIANDSISFEADNKEIVAIIGENGAGKSTFCKMLTGVYQPDGGKIFLNDKEYHPRNPLEAIRSGINMVYQERNLVGRLTGAQNICLGDEPVKAGGLYINDRKCTEIAERIKEQLGIDVDLSVPVETLGAGQQQLIEIMRAFHNTPQVLILDEPTASLGEGEVTPFLDFIRRTRDTMDIGIIFISHKIDEVFAIADRIAVFTDGRCVLYEKKENLTQEQCVRAMLRSDKIQPIEIPAKDYSSMTPVLEVEEAFYDRKVHHVPMTIYKGEVLGCYGLVGSGRTEFAEMLFGIRQADARSFTFNGETITNQTTTDMIERGMILTPEIRANGYFRSMSIMENIGNLFLKKKLSRGFGLVDFRKMRLFANEVTKKNDVKLRNVDQMIVELSGGNIQKVIIGRSVEIENFQLIILDEPTTGMDIGAKYEVYKRIRSYADEGNKGVLFISSELDELISVCDRIAVFADGNIVGTFDRKEIDKLRILETAVRGARS